MPRPNLAVFLEAAVIPCTADARAPHPVRLPYPFFGTDQGIADAIDRQLRFGHDDEDYDDGRSGAVVPLANDANGTDVR